MVKLIPLNQASSPPSALKRLVLPGIHAFISRIETEVIEKGKPLQKITKADISLDALIAFLILSQVGIIDLVAKGYTIMA